MRQTAKPIVDLIEAGNQVIIAHGNGPQVGMINLGMSTASVVVFGSDQPFSRWQVHDAELLAVLSPKDFD